MYACAQSCTHTVTQHMEGSNIRFFWIRGKMIFKRGLWDPRVTMMSSCVMKLALVLASGLSLIPSPFLFSFRKTRKNGENVNLRIVYGTGSRRRPCTGWIGSAPVQMSGCYLGGALP